MKWDVQKPPTCRFGVLRQALNAVRFVVYKQFCNANKNFQGDQKRCKKIALGKSHGLGEIAHGLVHAVCIANWRCPEPKIYHIDSYSQTRCYSSPPTILGLNMLGSQHTLHGSTENIRKGQNFLQLNVIWMPLAGMLLSHLLWPRP